jgi:hypothetical protein
MMTREETIKKVCKELINKSIKNISDGYRCKCCNKTSGLMDGKKIKHKDDCLAALAEKILYETCDNCEYTDYLKIPHMSICDNCGIGKESNFQPKE